eukprot:SM003807S14279  [mRNA]  locus=s3807:4:1340:+ [translate_table: standard]
MYHCDFDAAPAAAAADAAPLPVASSFEDCWPREPPPSPLQQRSQPLPVHRQGPAAPQAQYSFAHSCGDSSAGMSLEEDGAEEAESVAASGGGGGGCGGPSPRLSLPRRRGLSSYFGGKSKSFSCLAEVRTLRDLAKPEHAAAAAARRRKHAVIAAAGLERQTLAPLRACGDGGISKRSGMSGSGAGSPLSGASLCGSFGGGSGGAAMVAGLVRAGCWPELSNPSF